MSGTRDLRLELGAFVRTRREALSPSQAGLLAGRRVRRRTPGLRREEVADLCGISTTWYTWIEQGREITLSTAALARLADGLRLTAAERAYLFELARRRDPTPVVTHSAPAPAELRAVLEAVASPAYLLDRLWSARAWNGPAGELFAPWLGGTERCLLRFVFLDPAARVFICDWDDRARRLIAEFRADSARTPDDAGMRTLVDDLLRQSAVFADLWNGHAVLARGGGERRFNHPVRGMLRYRQTTLVPATHPDHKLVILLPGAQITA